MSQRVVIVTGGGSGIGRAAALQFAEAGVWTLVVGRRAGPLEETARHSDRIVPLAADMQSPSGIEAAIRLVTQRWNRLDALVNNAGMFVQGPLEEIDRSHVEALLATNVVAPTLMSQAALPLLKSSRGAIVNVSSTFGHKAAPLISHYAASKAALEHLTRCWALELAPHGVRVNAIAPGPTESEILARSGLSTAAVDAIKQSEAQRVPLGRRGTPEEVAAWIVRLADPQADWITGQIIAIDGGLSVA